MATNTKNYNLVKPAENELADINVINTNMDTIDQQILPVNSLTSEDSKKSLSAAQGKLLNDRIGDLSTLTTEHKGNLVQAINDAADGSGITVVTESEYKSMQESATVDPDKLYGIVDAFDSSAENVGISDTLATKLGITEDKTVESAIDSVDAKVAKNKNEIFKVNESLNTVGGKVKKSINEYQISKIYNLNEFCYENGKIYFSKSDNNLGNAVTDLNWWEPYNYNFEQLVNCNRKVITVDVSSMPTQINYTIPEDNTLYMKRMYTNLNINNYYQTVTETFYESDGITVNKTVTYALTYFDNGLINSMTRTVK